MMVSQWNSSGNVPRIHHIAALQQSPRVHVKNDRKARIYRTDHVHVDVQRHLLGSRDNEQECELSANFVSTYARRLSPGRWSFPGPGSERKWYSTYDSKPQGEWDRVAELMMIKFSESGHFVLRATNPLSRGTLKSTGGHQRTGRLVEDAYSSSYSEWNVDKTWSSQKWKSDEVMEDRTERLVLFAQHTDRFTVENDNMDSDTEAETEMSLKSRSFLHRVNVQVRKRQYESSKDATKDSDKHSVIWRMLMSSTLQASVFMEKNYSDNLHSIKNTEDLTMRKMFRHI